MSIISLSRHLLLSCILTAVLNYSMNAASFGTVVDLQFDSLPSAQGWTYDAVGTHAGAPESSLFNASGTALNQTTFGMPYAPTTPGRAIYHYSVDPGSIAGQSLFELVWESSISAHEFSRPEFRTAPFYVGVQLHGDYFLMGIKADELGVLVGSASYAHFAPSGFDGTVSHQYRVLIDTDADAWELFLDGTSVINGTTVASSLNEVTLGDGTGSGNANGQTTQLTLSVVPEPATFTLLGLGSLVLVMVRRPR